MPGAAPLVASCYYVVTMPFATSSDALVTNEA